MLDDPPSSLGVAAHHVDPESAPPGPVVATPRERAAPQPRLLAGVDGLVAGASAPVAAGLHLHDDDEAAAPGDEVELDAVGARVAGQDAVPPRLEKRRGAALPFAPQGVGVAAAHGVSGGIDGRGRRRTIQCPPMGTLRLVATPIGNLEDITLRALRVLGEADRIYAEDTRRTGVLLRHHGIASRPVSLHAHNETARIREVLVALDADEAVALVSDAGSPLVSDPGIRVVDAVLEAGHRVEAIPGPSAVIAALGVAGLAPQPFVFLGFLPRRSGARRTRLEAYRDRPETLVLFESPHRIGALLDDAASALGPRRACVARELTKLHEEVARGPLDELANRFRDGARGEITLVIEGDRGATRTAREGDR